jgi:hypothetical protein
MNDGYKWLYHETEKAMEDPRPGDRYQEMYSFWVYVVAAPADGSVVVAEASAPCTFPDDAKWRRFPDGPTFRQAYSYGGSMPGYWVRLASRGEDVSGWLERAAMAALLASTENAAGPQP